MAYVDKIGKYYYVRYKDESGKWKRKSCGKKARRKDADYLAKEYTARELNYHHKLPVRVIKTNLEKSLLKFRDEILPRSTIGIKKQESSIRREADAVNNIIFYLNAKGISRFVSFDKEIVLCYMDYRYGMEMSTKTIREELRLIKRFFKWAIKEHFCVDNPAEDITAPKQKKKIPRFFSMKELSAIFKAATEPYLSIFRFLFLTGLRTGELCNLEWRDYNWKTRRLTIRIVDADKEKRKPGNKTKREESIPLNNDAHFILKKRFEANESKCHIFLNGKGNSLDNDNIYKVLIPILNKLNIKDASPHTFRHSFASHLAIKGVSLYIIKDLLRHSSIRETEIYAHLSNKSTKYAAQKLSLDELKEDEIVTDNDNENYHYPMVLKLS